MTTEDAHAAQDAIDDVLYEPDVYEYFFLTLTRPAGSLFVSAASRKVADQEAQSIVRNPELCTDLFLVGQGQ
jgi:hypothetical protein